MTDLQRYLKSEFRDPEFQSHELGRQSQTNSRWGTVIVFTTLCLLIANLLYYSP